MARLPETIRPGVNIEVTYRGRRTVRGRVGFWLMKLGARLASQPLTLKRSGGTNG